MIGAVSASSAAPLRPITVKALACQCMACAPQRVLASPAAPISLSAPAVSPSLNVVAGESSGSRIDIGKNFGDETSGNATGLPQGKPAPGETGDRKTAPDETAKSATGEVLTDEERAQLSKLKARDREVRAHEQAHAAAGGALAGAPSYSYQTGPDGKQYAVGGEVPIRASASSANPRQAIAQLQQVARAATAPANPSGQDRAVAAQARAQIAELQGQLAQEAQAKAQEALKSASGEPESSEATKPQPTGLPKLPDLPEIAAPARASRTTAAQGAGDTPRHNAAIERPAGDQGLSGLVQIAQRAEREAATPGPIEVGRHNPAVAAYQQPDTPSKPPKIVGRIVSLNA